MSDSNNRFDPYTGDPIPDEAFQKDMSTGYDSQSTESENATYQRVDEWNTQPQDYQAPNSSETQSEFNEPNESAWHSQPYDTNQSGYQVPPETSQQGYQVPPETSQQAYQVPPENPQQGYQVPPETSQQGYQTPPENSQQGYQAPPDNSQQAYQVPPDNSNQQYNPYTGQPVYHSYQSDPEENEKKDRNANTFSIVSLICGIASILLSFATFCCCPFLSIPAAIAGIILGAIAKDSLDQRSGMALAGIITSICGIILTIIIGVLLISFSANLKLPSQTNFDFRSSPDFNGSTYNSDDFFH